MVIQALFIEICLFVPMKREFYFDMFYVEHPTQQAFTAERWNAPTQRGGWLFLQQKWLIMTTVMVVMMMMMMLMLLLVVVMMMMMMMMKIDDDGNSQGALPRFLGLNGFLSETIPPRYHARSSVDRRVRNTLATRWLEEFVYVSIIFRLDFGGIFSKRWFEVNVLKFSLKD